MSITLATAPPPVHTGYEYLNKATRRISKSRPEDLKTALQSTEQHVL